MEKFDYLFKLVLVGDSRVGKSNILSKYADDVFTENYIPTVGADFRISRAEVDQKKIKLQLWDTAGDERYMVIAESYYRRAHGIIIVFDLTNKKSFDRLSVWLKKVKSINSTAKICIVGNKSDMYEKREVTTDEGTAFATENDVYFYEVSAKDGSNIKSAFMKVIESVKQTVPDTSQLETLLKQFQSPIQASVEEDDKNSDLEDDENVLDEKTATDNEVLAAVGDPCTTVEYVTVIRRQFFELQNLKKLLRDRRTRR